MMSSSALNKVYGMLIKLWDKLTCINDVITPEAVDKLEDKLSRIFTMAKTHHYTQGQKYDHLASTIPKSKYRLVIRNATWTHMVPTDPGAYSADALSAGNAAATHVQFVAKNKIKQRSYRDYLNIEKAGKKLILCALGNDAVAPLKKQYISFWRHDCTSNDQTPTPENGNQDDDRAKI
jgi:hypothetical protein